jgi:hypothetical protein
LLSFNSAKPRVSDHAKRNSLAGENTSVFLLNKEANNGTKMAKQKNEIIAYRAKKFTSG